MISLGVYPHVDLATARRLHADARGLLARNIDPSADRKEKRAAVAHTFEVVAREWLRLLEPRVAKGLLAADTLKDATRILERDILPALGTRPIADISAHELLRVLKEIEQRPDEPFPLKWFLMEDQHNETRAARATSTLPPLSKETAMKTLTRTAFRFLQLALVALAGLSVNPQNVARAADPGRDAPPSVKVRISDLDLASPEGTATLYMRIRNAARTVCGTMDIRLLEEKTVWDRCVNESIANAVTEVGSANLTAYYLARTHRSHALATAQISKPVDPR